MSSIKISDEIVKAVAEGHGKGMARFNGMDPLVLAGDMLNPDKAPKNYATLSRYIDPKGKRILEIGSGYGTNLIIWTKQFDLDVSGVEPEGEGFSETIAVSAKLCELNGVSPDRIKISSGEKLPFPDESFDIVYSSNVLEHTHDPGKVLGECFRVLRPNGVLHFELPNFLSFFEGHYHVLMPPILWKWMLPFWVKWVCGRDPAFARTLRTEINPFWLRRTVGIWGKTYPLRIRSLGEEIFCERLARTSFEFEHKSTSSKLAPLIGLLLKCNKGNVIAKLLVFLRAYYPLYLTVQKLPLAEKR